MIIVLTGHRPGKLNSEYDLNGPMTRWLETKITEVLLKEHPSKIISGAALGADQLFILVGIKLNIPVLAAIPCLNQEKMWPSQSKELYNRLLNSEGVEKCYVTNKEYTKSCMQDRNKFMVNQCDKLLAIFDGSPGGTNNCISYAKSIGKEIIRINPKDFYNE